FHTQTCSLCPGGPESHAGLTALLNSVHSWTAIMMMMVNFHRQSAPLLFSLSLSLSLHLSISCSAFSLFCLIFLSFVFLALPLYVSSPPSLSLSLSLSLRLSLSPRSEEHTS